MASMNVEEGAHTLDVVTDFPEISTASNITEEDPHHEAKIVPTIFFIILLVGVIGNSIVIYVILKTGRGRVKSATNCYIVNLAVTDICFLLCCVPWTAILFIFSEWKIGLFMCRFVFYMMHVTTQSTCLTLTAMSVDRYRAIVRPLKSMQHRSARGVSIIIFAIWLFSFVTAIPVFVYYGIDAEQIYETGVQICQELWPMPEVLFPAYALYCLIMMYLGPLVVISMCYVGVLCKVWDQVMPGLDGAHLQSGVKEVRQRRHVTWKVLVVVVVFAFCWLPLYILNIWERFVGVENFPRTNAMLIFKTAGLILAYANSCVNPFIYSFMGQNFRRNFMRVCPSLCKKRQRDYIVGTSRRTTRTTSVDDHLMVERGVQRYSMTSDTVDLKRPSNGSLDVAKVAL